jgi:hypothetical protein
MAAWSLHAADPAAENWVAVKALAGLHGASRGWWGEETARSVRDLVEGLGWLGERPNMHYPV